MDPAYTITAFVTLFVVMDPIALAPLFLALTRDMPPARRQQIARRALIVAAALLTLFGLAGDSILRGIGISLPAFRIAGGMLLFLTAMDMLFERRTQRREDKADHPQDHADDPSVFPLGTPLIAGPGALATMILLNGQGEGWGHFLLVEAVMLSVIVISALLFAVAAPIGRALGRTGVMVVTRLLGMLLAALAIQFIIDGLAGTGLF